MKLFIGCSSRNDIPKMYLDDCKHFLSSLMKENDLVFGAYDGGLMGIAYQTTLDYKNNVIGVCPEAYKDDFKNLNCTDEVIAKSVNERTEKAISLSDALIFLPGGIGTIYELYASIESKRCHEFDKPIIIYNSKGFYDKLLDFMEKLYQEKFLKEEDRKVYFVSDSLDEILNYIQNYQTFEELKKIKKY